MEGMIYIRHGSSFDKGPIYHDGENIFFDFAIGSAKISSGKTVTNGQLIDIDGTVTNGLYIDNDGTMTTGIRLDGAAADGIVIAGTSSDNAIEITGVAQGAGILIDYTIPTATSYALHIDMDTALAAGDVEGMVLALTNTVNGINNFRAFTSDLTMGANCAGPYAGYFRVDIADATVTGLSAALGMELILSSVSGANGEAHGMTIDVACPDATSSPGSSSNKHSFIKLETWGNQTGENAWDDNANIFFLNGLTSGAGNIVSAQEQTLRINIEGTSRYLVLSSAENNLTLATTGGTSIAIGASTTGIALTGARTTGISMAGGASYNPIHIGVKSNTASQGLVLTGVLDDMGGIMVFCDDGGVDLTNSWSTSPIWTRYAITANQTSNTATGAYLQLKMVGNRTLTSCDYSAVKAYVECSGTVGLTTADIAPINVTLELGGNITNTSGTVAGINIDINTGSSYSITDTAVDSAGIIIRKTSGSTAAWPVGLKINDSGTTTAISVGICTTGLSITGATGNAIAIVTSGKFAMGVQGTGIPVTTAAPHTMQVHTKPAVALDDYTSSFGIRSRYEVSTAQTNIVTIHAVDGRFRPKANIGQGIFAGVCGYVEADSTLTYAGSADSVMAAGLFTVEMDTTVTLTSGRVIGVGIDSATNGSLDVSNATFTALRIWAGSGKEPWTYGITIEDAVTGIAIGTCTTGINIAGNSVIPQQVTIGDTTNPVHWDGAAENWLIHTECTDTTTASKTCYKFVLDAAHSAATTSGRLESLRAEVRSYSDENISGSIRALVGQVSFMDDCTYVGAGPQGCFGLVSSVWSGSNLTATGDVFSLGIFQGVETGSAYNGESAMIYCYQYGKTSVESLIRLDCNIGATSQMSYFLDCDGLSLDSHHDFFSTDTCATNSGPSDGCIKIRVGATVYEIPIFTA